MLQGITEQAKKQAQQRINSRFVKYVPVMHNLELKSIHKVDVVDALQNHKNSKKQEIT